MIASQKMPMSWAALDRPCDPPQAQSDSLRVSFHQFHHAPGYLRCSEQDFKVHMEDLECSEELVTLCTMQGDGGKFHKHTFLCRSFAFEDHNNCS